MNRRRFVFIENFEILNLDNVVRIKQTSNNDAKIYLITGECFISKDNWKFLSAIVKKEIEQTESPPN